MLYESALVNKAPLMLQFGKAVLGVHGSIIRLLPLCYYVRAVRAPAVQIQQATADRRVLLELLEKVAEVLGGRRGTVEALQVQVTEVAGF
jgi:hypothetical protein